VTYSWTVVQTGVTGATAGTGSSINQILTNSGIVNGTATYTITPTETLSGCVGTPLIVVVTVKPVPNVTAVPMTSTLTSGETTDIVLSSNITGTTYSWTVVQTGVTGATAGTGSSISQVLTGEGTVTYRVTPTFNGCAGQFIDVVVTVEAEIIECLADFEIIVDYLDTGCATGHNCNAANFYLEANGVNVGLAALSNTNGSQDLHIMLSL
jgi:hypothetical protein